jgi:hypothetical protein
LGILGENSCNVFCCSSWYFEFLSSRCFACGQCRCCGMSPCSSRLRPEGVLLLIFLFVCLFRLLVFSCKELFYGQTDLNLEVCISNSMCTGQ